MAHDATLDCDISVSSKANLLLNHFVLLNQSVIKDGLKVQQLKNINSTKSCRYISHGKSSGTKNGYNFSYMCLGIFLISICSNILFRLPYFDGMMKNALGIKCVVPNNYLVWEATRPVADCNICRGVNSVMVLPNVTRDEFLNYAYSYRPIIIKNAAGHWPAMKVFSYSFFRDLFESTPGSYESIDEECQFLNFKTDLYSLKQVFSMSQKRVRNADGERPWYIGWYVNLFLPKYISTNLCYYV